MRQISLSSRENNPLDRQYNGDRYPSMTASHHIPSQLSCSTYRFSPNNVTAAFAAALRYNGIARDIRTFGPNPELLRLTYRDDLLSPPWLLLQYINPSFPSRDLACSGRVPSVRTRFAEERRLIFSPRIRISAREEGGSRRPSVSLPLSFSSSATKPGVFAPSGLYRSLRTNPPLRIPARCWTAARGPSANQLVVVSVVGSRALWRTRALGVRAK